MSFEKWLKFYESKQQNNYKTANMYQSPEVPGLFIPNIMEPKQKLPILGAFLNGENIHESKFPSAGILVMGNESNGINKEIEKLISKKITIPAYGKAESLNVAIATAVILDNWLK